MHTCANRNGQLFLVFILALSILHSGAEPVTAGEQRFEPGITVSEEFNDNILLAPRSMNQMTDYITRVMPSLHYVYAAPFWEWDAAYAYDFRYYAEGTKENDSTHVLNVSNHTTLIREFFFVDVSDIYRRVSIDTTRDYTTQSLFINQTDSNEFVLKPYINFNLTTKTTGTTGYQFRDLWYQQRGLVDRREHTVFIDFVDELSPRTSLTAGARYVSVEARTPTFGRTDVYAGPRFEYAEGSEVWLILGNSWIDPENGGESTQGSWDAGVSHRFVTYNLSFNAALTYIDDPTKVQRREDRYVARLRKETDRLSLDLITGRWEYRNISTKHLETTRHSVGGSASYALTPSLRGTYSLSIDRYDDNRLRMYSMLYLNTARLEYRFPANSVLAFEYRFLHGYSPDELYYHMNYDNNRAVVEFRKLF